MNTVEVPGSIIFAPCIECGKEMIHIDYLGHGEDQVYRFVHTERPGRCSLREAYIHPDNFKQRGVFQRLDYYPVEFIQHLLPEYVQERIAGAVAEEREACARIADELHRREYELVGDNPTLVYTTHVEILGAASRISDAIRARHPNPRYAWTPKPEKP